MPLFRPNRGRQDRRQTRSRPPLPPTIRLLGGASLLNDIASEMITPILPIYLTATLGAGPAAVGLIEGMAEAASSGLKWVSGRAADRQRRFRGFVLGGYALSNLARPLVALAAAWPVVLALRFMDRVGKGIRTAPRDAMISRTTAPAERGRAFGFHRAMDHAGATVGPLAAFGLLAAGARMEWVFLLSAVPGMVLLAWLAARLREPAGAVEPDPVEPHRPPSSAVPGAARGVVAAAAMQAFALVPDAFLVLWAAERGLATATVPLVWAAAHAVRAPLVRLAGGWSDTRRRAVVAAGWAARVAGLAALAFAPPGAAWTVALFLAWAGIVASTEGAERAMVADLSTARAHGTAFGSYHMAIGLAALPGALAFGAVWEAAGRTAAFGLSAVVTILATIVLLIRVRGARIG